MKSYNALQFLDRQGVITLSQEFSQKITVQFVIPSKEVIRYTSLNPADEEMVLTLVRSYPGIYDMPAAINLSFVAKKSKKTESEVLTFLQKLHAQQLIDYHAKNNDATLTFNEVREDERTINRISKYLVQQNSLKTARLQAMADYVANNTECRSNLILKYFGEAPTIACGICSYCIQQLEPKRNTNGLYEEILGLIQSTPRDSRELQILTKSSSADITFALQILLETDQIVLSPDNYYIIK
jgi:ATP-dependent DNA helicase RecQ